MSNNRYTEEFRIEAVKQVADRGHSVAEVASRLGITTHSLYAWKKKYGPDSAKHQVLAAEQAEIPDKPTPTNVGRRQLKLVDPHSN